MVAGSNAVDVQQELCKRLGPCSWIPWIRHLPSQNEAGHNAGRTQHLACRIQVDRLRCRNAVRPGQLKGVEVCNRRLRRKVRLINNELDDQAHVASGRCTAIKDSRVIGEAATSKLQRNESVAGGHCLDNQLGAFSRKIVHVRWKPRPSEWHKGAADRAVPGHTGPLPETRTAPLRTKVDANAGRGWMVGRRAGISESPGARGGERWSGRADSNRRPLGPKPSALPLGHAPTSPRREGWGVPLG